MTDGGQRAATDKTCPVVLRSPQGKCEILAFCHPLAGHQFVKGTVEAGETPAAAALRELYEEAGKRPKPLPRCWVHQTRSNQVKSGIFLWSKQTLYPTAGSINALMTAGNCLDFSGTQCDSRYQTALSIDFTRRCILSALNLIYCQCLKAQCSPNTFRNRV